MINVQNVSKTFILHHKTACACPSYNVPRSPSTQGMRGASTATPAAANQPCCARCTPTICPTRANPDQTRDEWVAWSPRQPRKVVEIRKTTIGWVSQFLRVIPRIQHWKW